MKALKRLEKTIEGFESFRWTVFFATDGSVQELQITRENETIHLGIIETIGIFDFGPYSHEVKTFEQSFQTFKQWRPSAEVLLETLRVFSRKDASFPSWIEHKTNEKVFATSLSVLGEAFSVEDFAAIQIGNADKTRLEVIATRLGKHLYGGAIGVKIWNSIPAWTRSKGDWSGIQLPGAELEGVGLAGTFCDANFDKANLNAANFWNTNITGATFRGASLQKARLDWIRAFKTNFAGADLRESNLSHVDMDDSILVDAKLTNSDLSWIKLRRADLTNADLTEVDLTGATLEGAIFHNCVLRDAVLSNTSASGANFSNASLVRADFKKSDLSGAVFEGADLTNANLTGANLCGVDLTNCITDGVKYKDAGIDDQTKLPDGVRETARFVWRGKMPDISIEEKIATVQVASIEEFMQHLRIHVEVERLKNALSMLKRDTFQLFSQVNEFGIEGVTRSQSDTTRVYACILKSDGAFSCATQNLRPCGGLRGALCKHILLLVIGLAKAGSLDLTDCTRWILKSLLVVNQKHDKQLTTEIFLRFKGVESGEIDWRPIETIPEDYYSL